MAKGGCVGKDPLNICRAPACTKRAKRGQLLRLWLRTSRKSLLEDSWDSTGYDLAAHVCALTQRNWLTRVPVQVAGVFGARCGSMYQPAKQTIPVPTYHKQCQYPCLQHPDKHRLLTAYQLFSSAGARTLKLDICNIGRTVGVATATADQKVLKSFDLREDSAIADP